jgi:hypothetical protein
MVIHGVGWKRVVRAQMIHNAILGNTTKLFYFNYSNMTTITYPNSKFVFTDASGNTGTTILPESITTPSITVSSIVDSTGSTGASGYVLSSTGDGIAWIPQSGGFGNITSDLNMNNYNINNIDTINSTNLNSTNIYGNATFSNQISFSSSPFCSVGPTGSSHLANKLYVDSILSSGNYNLFLNRSQTVTVGTTGFSLMSSTISPTITATPISTIVPANSTRSVISFISNELNITELRTSLINLNIYGNNITGVHSIYYTFNVKLYSGGTMTTLGSTGQSSTILNNATTYPLMYTMSITIPTISTLATDMIILELNAINKSTTTSVTLNTYFENNWYSYLQIQSNSMNPLQFSPWINTATSDLNMNGYNITSTGDLTISCPTKILTLGNQSSINLGSSGGSINLGNQNSTINLLKPLTINDTNTSVNNSTTWRSTISIGFDNAVEFPTTGILPTITRQLTVSRGVWFICVHAGINISRSGPTADSRLEIYKTTTQSTTTTIGSQSTGGFHTPTTQEIISCCGIFSVSAATEIIIIKHYIRRQMTTAQFTSYMPFPKFVRIA